MKDTTMVTKHQNTTLPPIVRSVLVRRTAAEAFEIFTAKMGSWWPLNERHSIFAGDLDRLVVEGRVGGQIKELSTAGAEGVWGTIVEWDPPRGFSMTWHPGRAPVTAQRLTITFAPSDDGRTLVTLVHTGWDALGADAAETHSGYARGWDFVFNDRFGAVCA